MQTFLSNSSPAPHHKLNQESIISSKQEMATRLEYPRKFFYFCLASASEPSLTEDKPPYYDDDLKSMSESLLIPDTGTWKYSEDEDSNGGSINNDTDKCDSNFKCDGNFSGNFNQVPPVWIINKLSSGEGSRMNIPPPPTPTSYSLRTTW